MPGYFLVLLLVPIFGLWLLSSVIGYLSARFVFWLRNYWMGH